MQTHSAWCRADARAPALQRLAGEIEPFVAADTYAVGGHNARRAGVRPSMHDGNAVAALLPRYPDWPGPDPTLDRLTAAFQRDPRPIELHLVIQQWRRERGLPEVPLPAWSR